MTCWNRLRYVLCYAGVMEPRMLPMSETSTTNLWKASDNFCGSISKHWKNKQTNKQKTQNQQTFSPLWKDEKHGKILLCSLHEFCHLHLNEEIGLQVWSIVGVKVKHYQKPPVPRLGDKANFSGGCLSKYVTYIKCMTVVPGLGTTKTKHRTLL